MSVCIVCEDGYEENELIIQCSTCQRWCHGECDNIQNEDDAEKCASEGYSCQLCRPNDVLPPHMAQPIIPKKSSSLLSSPPHSPDYSGGMSAFSSASYVLDNVVLTERGMCMLKSQTVEKEKATRKRKRILNMDPDRSIFDTIESVVSGGGSADTSLDNDPDALEEDDDLMPPPTPTVGNQHKDGDIVRPLPDGRPPEPPEGFSVVTKDNGVMVLRKRRYRDLKKVGIGGFQAKSRNTNKKTKEEPAESPDGGEKPKKRQAWRPKKNKILAQYPEYIQESFFGRSFLDSCSSSDPLKPLADEHLNVEADEDTTTFELGKEALAALAEKRKAKELEKKKKKEDEEEAARAKTALETKKSDEKAGKEDGIGKVEEDAEKMEVDEELLPGDLLPSDLFGDDIFKSLMDGDGAEGLEDIDETALEEAEKEDEANKEKAADSKHDDDLVNAIASNLPDFKLDSKEMADIFNIMEENPDSKPAECEDDKSKIKLEQPNEEDSSSQQVSNPATSICDQQPALPNTSVPDNMSPMVQRQAHMQQNNFLPPQNRPAQPDIMVNQAIQEQQPQAPINIQPPHQNTPIPRQVIVTSHQQQQLMSQQVQPHQMQPCMPPQPPQPGHQMVRLPQQQMHGPVHPQQQQMFQPMAQQQQQMQQQRMMHMQQQQQIHRQQMLQRHAQPQQMQQQMMPQHINQNPAVMGQQQLSHQHSPHPTPVSVMNQPPAQPVQQRMQQPLIQSAQAPGRMVPQQQPNQAMRAPMPQPQPPQQQPGFQSPPAPLNVQTSPSFPSAPSPFHQPEYSNTSPQMPSPAFSSDSQSSWTGGATTPGPGPAGPPGPSGPTPGSSGAIPATPDQPSMPQPSQTPPQLQRPTEPSTASTAKRNQSMKLESDEPLGENATIAMILYSNKNHPNLKTDYPNWSDRMKQIAKIWKNLPNDSRQPYVQQARENRTASRVNKQVGLVDFTDISILVRCWTSYISILLD